VSTGSFYHQFSDKEDLLLELLRNDGAAVLEALAKSREPEGADPSQAPRRRDRLLHALFDMADGYPEFVKIYVREYHSDSPRVRREIRAHRDRTIAGVKPYYESLRNLTGLPLDVDAIATLLSVQSFSLISYYIELPKSDRAATRERLIRGMIQLGSGGILAMLEEEGGGSTRRSGGSGAR
jgi:AcrR family transcriptional regulator